MNNPIFTKDTLIQTNFSMRSESQYRITNKIDFLLQIPSTNLKTIGMIV